MSELSLLDEVREEAPVYQPRIMSDDDAQKALMKIKALRDNVLMWEDHYARQLESIKEKAAAEEKYWTDELRVYFESLPTDIIHTTKTQSTYDLPCGSIVRKAKSVSYVRDEKRIIEWARVNAPEYIKVKESVDWDGLKKLCEKGTNAIKETGEVIDGVTLTEKPEEFVIKV